MSDLRSVKITNFSNSLEDELKAAGIDKIGACIQCGTCTGGCPSGRRTALKTRAIMRKVQLGLEEVLYDKDIWYCSTCYTCMERCPRKIPITDIMIELRNLAVRKGNMHPTHVSLSQNLFKTGHGVPIDNEKWEQLRQFHELPSKPPTVHSHPEAVNELQILLESSKFDELVGIGLDESTEDVEFENEIDYLSKHIRNVQAIVEVLPFL
ncbi:MAG: CoB--CoM heterodisulfide reductase subunit C [Candidatus Hermodarchaeota archaeon]